MEGGLDPAPDNRAHLDVCYEVLTWERDCVTIYDEYGIGDKQCSDWFFVGSYMVGNCFSSGGGGGSNSGSGYYNPTSESGMSCNSFDFRTIAGNWQEACVNNAKIKIRWIGGIKSGLTIDITLGALVVVGIPLHRAGGITYYPGRAAEIAAEASNFAQATTAQILKYEPYRSTDAVIESTYRHWFNLFMQKYGGTAGRTSSRSPVIVFKNASYTFLGNGDCD